MYFLILFFQKDETYLTLLLLQLTTSFIAMKEWLETPINKKIV